MNNDKYRNSVHIHRADVYELMGILISAMDRQRSIHDASKLKAEEFDTYARIVPKLKKLEFGSDEYKSAVKELGPALEHHYNHNRHHPQFHDNGVKDMNLVDIAEMLCDWIAAAEAKNDDPKNGMVKFQFGQYDIEEPLRSILLNTVDFIRNKRK